MSSFNYQTDYELLAPFNYKTSEFKSIKLPAELHDASITGEFDIISKCLSECHENQDSIIVETIRRVITNCIFDTVGVIDSIITTFHFDINSHRDTLIEKCLETSRTDVLQYFIDANLDIHNDIKILNNQTPTSVLRVACKLAPSIVSIILKNGVDPNSENGAAFLYVVRGSKRDLIKIFIEFGVDVTTQNNLALFYAVQRFDFETIKLLINAGAQINDIPKTVSETTSERINTKIKYLVDIGIDPLDIVKMWASIKN